MVINWIYVYSFQTYPRFLINEDPYVIGFMWHKLGMASSSSEKGNESLVS